MVQFSSVGPRVACCQPPALDLEDMLRPYVPFSVNLASGARLQGGAANTGKGISLYPAGTATQSGWNWGHTECSLVFILCSVNPVCRSKHRYRQPSAAAMKSFTCLLWAAVAGFKAKLSSWTCQYPSQKPMQSYQHQQHKNAMTVRLQHITLCANRASNPDQAKHRIHSDTEYRWQPKAPSSVRTSIHIRLNF